VRRRQIITSHWQGSHLVAAELARTGPAQFLAHPPPRLVHPVGCFLEASRLLLSYPPPPLVLISSTSVGATTPPGFLARPFFFCLPTSRLPTTLNELMKGPRRTNGYLGRLGRFSAPPGAVFLGSGPNSTCFFSREAFIKPETKLSPCLRQTNSAHWINDEGGDFSRSLGRARPRFREKEKKTKRCPG